MKIKVFKKFYYTTSLILLLTLTLVFVILSFAMNNAITKNTFDKLTKSSEVISNFAVNSENVSELKDDVLDLSAGIEKINEFDVFITDSNGKIIICTCNDYLSDEICEHTDSVVNKSILNKIENSNHLELTTLNGRFSKPRYVCAKRVYI